ncbi:cytochrome P450 [Daldinia vernicosa]|uniref:cytochrome P450 n=1 Tax=Daldinia vernicosa TaxID=114800 RepID=UPI00200870AD|nr:cytochrome P450 [Daldinia vernicosa]KAI0846352.1 cytochrome P450 [Daldinia vernicosa]
MRILTNYDTALMAFGLVASLLILLPMLILAASTMRFNITITQKGDSKRTPTLPYMLPFIFHGVPLICDPAKFITEILMRYGWRRPLRIRVRWLQYIIVANPSHIQTIFKSSKQLTSKPAILHSLKHILKSPAHAVAFYAADNSGIAASPRKGSNIKHHNRINFHQAHTVHEFLSGQHLTHIADRYLTILQRNLSSLFASRSDDWVEYPDLYQFIQIQATKASIETIMGSKILEINPNIIDDFWEFDNNVPQFLKCLPRWMMPAPFKARDRVHDSIKKWHAYAHAHSDCSRISANDPEWEPFFGTKMIRARQNYMLKMKPLDADARASEDLGLMMASNGNAVPCIFWFIYEALRHQSLQEQMVAEVTSCMKSGELDITSLSAQPLLQSVYAEVLRLRIATGVARVSEFGAFNLDGYHIKEGQPIIIFSRPAALNEETWARAGKSVSETAPLDEFYAERFLVSMGDGDQRKNTTSSTSASAETKYSFSLNGLAGSWIPYGGGQRMCPGRHLAKGEMIGTFAVLFTQYDIELTAPHSPKIESDLKWFPVGALPPVGKVPFRIRSRPKLD